MSQKHARLDTRVESTVGTHNVVSTAAEWQRPISRGARLASDNIVIVSEKISFSAATWWGRLGAAGALQCIQPTRVWWHIHGDILVQRSGIGRMR